MARKGFFIAVFLLLAVGLFPVSHHAAQVSTSRGKNRAYRDSPQAISKKKCLGEGSNRRCGYNCMKNQFSQVTCAENSAQQCLKNKLGKVVCGYNCVKTKNGGVKCSQAYQDPCVTTTLGQTRCGEGCRLSEDKTQITCESGTS